MARAFNINTTVLTILGACVSIIIFGMPSLSHAYENEMNTKSTVKQNRTAKVDATCMQSAVVTREGALLSAWEGFGEDITTAIKARKTAFNEAWGLTDIKAQRTAIAQAWKDWKMASKNAHGELRKDRKAAWDAFRKTTKDSCKVTAPKEEGLEKDVAGTIAL